MKRPLRHIMATMLLLLCATLVQAQEMGLREITRLYADGHYEHCIRKALTYTGRHPNDALGYLMVAMPKLQLHFLDDGPGSDDLLRDAMYYTVEAHKRDTMGIAMEPYAWEMNELYRLIRQKGNEMYNSVNKPRSAEYFKCLADIYGEVTPEYTEFYGPVKTVMIIPPPPVVDVADAGSNNIIKFAESLRGIHYRVSGTTTDGFDCSGYVRYVFAAHNIELPHSSQSMSEMGKEVSLKKAQPGDLIFFGTRKGKKIKVHHVGIVHDNDNGQITFIHSSTSEGVTIDGPTTASWDYWEKRILFVKRVTE